MENYFNQPLQLTITGKGKIKRAKQKRLLLEPTWV